LHQIARGFCSSLIASSLQHSVQPLQLRPSTICTVALTQFPFALERAG
jgi:hypothetical protein